MIDFRIADPLANSLCTSHRFPVIYRSTIRPPGALASPVYCHMLRPDCGYALGLGHKNIRFARATPNSHRLAQILRALIGNPSASQQLMGQSPICYCLKAKKFNDEVPPRSPVIWFWYRTRRGCPVPRS